MRPLPTVQTSGTRMFQLSEVADIVMGQSPPGTSYNERGEGLPFFQGKAEFGEDFPTPVKWCSAPSRIAESGDILMSVRAPVGPTNVASERCCIGRGLAAIRARTTTVEADYLLLFFKYLEPVLATKGQGSTFTAINKKELHSLPVPVPSLDEQRNMVDILKRADGIRRLRRQAQETVQQLIPALFIDMFGDPATNPRSYSVRTVGEIADVQGGLQVTRKRADFPIERPYLRVANVYRNRLDLSEVKTIRLTQAELERVRLQAGDLLVVEGHGNKDEVGRCAIWDASIVDCVHQNHLIRVRPNREAVLPEFLSTYLNSAGGREHLLRQGKTTSGLNTISTANVKTAPVFVPQLDHQKAFVERLAMTSSIGQQQETAHLLSESTFQSLLHKAFSGNL